EDNLTKIFTQLLTSEVISTPRLSRCRKPERGTSVGCWQSAAGAALGQGSGRDVAQGFSLLVCLGNRPRPRFLRLMRTTRPLCAACAMPTASLGCSTKEHARAPCRLCQIVLKKRRIASELHLYVQFQVWYIPARHGLYRY